MEPGRLVLVTDRAAAGGRELVDVVDAALAGLPPGGALVQLREKDLAPRELYALARRLLEVTRARRCPLLINDRVDVALAAGADGVHLPEAGLPIAAARRLSRPGPFMVGTSVHGADAAGAAARDGADLILCGPVWDTPSKRGMGAPIGEAELAAAARAIAGAGSAARLYGIGGVVSAERAAAAAAAGAHGVAVIRAVMAAGDPGGAAAALYDAVASSS
ncbi:MAG TPA: thiamine phosphate synthase [Kofleriaceae bacterium]|nr:thiamine phosphate synthase [Kofleriaceae bacterium]